MIAAPEPVRARFRGQKLPATPRTAAALRVDPSWDTEISTVTVTTLRSLARPVHLLRTKREHTEDDRGIIRGWRPDLLEQ